MTQVWPPDYSKEFAKRAERLSKLQKNPAMKAGAFEYYRTRPIEFIEDWCCTYDPRNAEKKLPTIMPFILFPRQKELVLFLQSCVIDGQSGLLEKARDMGATWVCSAFSTWLWLFKDGASVGWGSRKEMLVDQIGNVDSVFGKIRMTIQYLPRFFWPEGFNPKEHMTYMKIINPANGATITGEAGDNIGRGGRKLIYFKDEAQPLRSQVLTPGGWRYMGELSVGDKVLGQKGNVCSITQIKEFESRGIYKIGFHDGTFAECTPNHLWKVNRVWGKKETLILSAKEIADRYTYSSPGGQTQYLFRVEPCAPIEFLDAGIYPLHPYIVGALLGDGGIKDVPNNCVKITSADSEIINRVAGLLPKGCIIKKCAGYNYRIVDEKLKTGKGIRSRARIAVVHAGIAGHGAETKFIPHQYKMGSIADRLDLLRGLMDTDGSASGGVASFHTCSRELAEDLMFVVRSLGGLVTFNIKPDHRGYRDMYVLHIVLPDSQSPFYLTRKTNNLRKRKHPLSRTIVSVQKIDDLPARCISVDSEDGLYITDDFIVTHNSAHYERPELVEAALGDNTDVQIDLSSVNGTANVFYRRREKGQVWEAGKEMERGRTRVFIMDWRDHPAKTVEWYNERRKKAEDEGLLHLFKQEVDRDYTGAVENLLIPAEWVKAAIDAHQKLGIPIVGRNYGGLDVADEGGDKNAAAVRKGDALVYVDHWGEGDTTDTAVKGLKIFSEWEVSHICYDSVGVGAGVKAAFNKLPDAKRFTIKPWNGGESVINPTQRVIKYDPNSPTNKDFFANLKAQAWWSLRTRFHNVFKMVQSGTYDPKVEIIIIPSGTSRINEIKLELSQPTYLLNSRGQVLVDKKPDGAKSPNLADAVVMAFFPKETPFFA